MSIHTYMLSNLMGSVEHASQTKSNGESRDEMRCYYVVHSVAQSWSTLCDPMDCM